MYKYIKKRSEKNSIFINMFFKITGLLGGKKGVKSLGVFCLILFGVCGLILNFSSETVQPSWITWIFWGGAVLGLILLLGGLFADDAYA